MALIMPGMLVNIAGAVAAMQRLNPLSVIIALVLGLALGISIASLLFAIYFVRQNRRTRQRMLDKPVHWSRQRRWRPTCWTGPCQWLAIRDCHPHMVQAALHLNNPTPCSWEEGLSAAHEQKLFIAPPVRGWTLVMGASLPEPAEDVDACFHFLRQLSHKLGQVHFFSYNLALQHHAWAQAENGEIRRAYAWAGRTIWNQGSLSIAENELGLHCYDYGETPDRIPFGQVNPLAVNTECVTLLAARWSVNPTTIDFRFVKDGHGIAGQLSSSQLH